MKRNIDDMEDVNDTDCTNKNIRLCIEQPLTINDVENISVLLKQQYSSMASEEFDSCLKITNKYFDLINYSIMKDDDVLLDIIVRKWSSFEENFNRNKVIYKKNIVDVKSHKCFGYFVMILGQKFLPENYYHSMYA